MEAFAVRSYVNPKSAAEAASSSPLGVQLAIEELDAKIKDLESAMSALDARLAPVVIPRPEPGPTGVQKPESRSACMIGQAISAAGQRVVDVSNHIRSVTNSLDV